jgi:hypothetical protein
MQSGGLGIACLSMVIAAACGGEAGADLSRRGVDGPSSVDRNEPDAAAVPVLPVPAPVGPSVPEVLPPPFEGPGCPPASTTPGIRQCEPLATPTGCPDGQSCFPFVDYPRGPCDVERFGTLCRPAGVGTQGDPCGDQACAADHICVSTGRGTQCVRLCSFGDDANSVCDPGLLCLPIDIEGFGGCL